MDTTISKTKKMNYTYLALGDSYTIGEQVLLAQSFPYQTVQLLRQQGYSVVAPEIIATTGHTTDELVNSINETTTLKSYDIVSVLIGVNNQYRSRAVENFELEFESLLLKAIAFANEIATHVFVLSIPDWGITPFAIEKDTVTIANEIDGYNAVCKSIANKHHTHFIDITTLQRQDGKDMTYLATDMLHPSAKEYAKWANFLANKIIEVYKYPAISI
jgi:lysophospholipase L1-like esterase